MTESEKAQQVFAALQSAEVAPPDAALQTLNGLMGLVRSPSAEQPLERGGGAICGLHVDLRGRQGAASRAADGHAVDRRDLGYRALDGPRRVSDSSAREARLQWRAMTADDLAAVDAIAARVHPDYPEDSAIFAERLQLYPNGCRVLATVDAGLVGYAVSHPWHLGQPVALNALLGAIPSLGSSATYYIHDIALLPEARGGGAGADIVTWLARHARAAGLPSMSLVAVNDSGPFWRSQGFTVVDNPALRAKLACYGGQAQLMTRDLA